MINPVQDKMESILKIIKEVGGVEEVYMLYCVYDIVVKIKAARAILKHLKK